jgi:hypothetical protein
MISQGWESLRDSIVLFDGNPVGTIAAMDNSDEKLNYDQVPDCSHNLLTKLMHLFHVFLSKI